MIKRLISKFLFRIVRHEACVSFKKHLFNLGDPIGCQQKVLFAKLKRSQHSEFGKKYDFASMQTIHDFRSRVPIHSYHDLKPYIDRVVAGDETALFNKGEKILMFALTSGTTESCKYVPVTRCFLKEYKAGSFRWGYQMAVDHPAMLDNKILAIVSPYDEEYTAHGVPCGAISGLVAATQKKLARMLYALPYWVYAIPDQKAKYYTLMRLAVAEPNIGLVTTANPSTLIKIAQFADEYKDDIIRDIRDGTFSFSPGIRHKDIAGLPGHIVRNPARADELQRIVDEHGRLYPKYCWKNMPVIATWKGGVLGHYIDILPHYYGNIPIRDLGLIASEGRMSVPFEDTGCSGVLDVESHFFEFIPEEEYEKPEPKTLLCNEVEVGKNYYLLLTTSAGYFRYDIHDLVKVTGFFEDTPCICFLNKGRHISSLTGEKISEHQVMLAIREAMQKVDAHFHYYVVSPCWDDVPFYAVNLENNEEVQGVDLEKFKQWFDVCLQEHNCEYQAKRQSGRLDIPRVFLIKKGTFDALKYLKFEQAPGRTEQYKHVYLKTDVDYHKNLEVVEVV